MALVAAICTSCGGKINVDNSKEAGICELCGTPFVTEKVIQNFVTNNVTNVTNNNSFAGANIQMRNGPSDDTLLRHARKELEEKIRKVAPEC